MSRYGWVCYSCATFNSWHYSHCAFCGLPRGQSIRSYGFFQHTFVSHPSHHYDCQSSERATKNNVNQNSNQNKKDGSDNTTSKPTQTTSILSKNIKLLELFIVGSKKDKDNPYKDSIKDILKKLKSKLETELGEDDKEILTQNKYAELLKQLIDSNSSSNYSDLTNLQKKLYITADVIDSPLIKKLFDLLTGAEILSALGISPPPDKMKKEGESAEKKEDKKEGEKKEEKKEEKKYTSEELMKKIQKDWKKGNLDDIKQNLESDVLKEYKTTPLKESITKLINSKNSIIRTIEKIKQQKLNKQLNINQEPQTDDDILKDLEDANDDDDDDDDDDD